MDGGSNPAVGVWRLMEHVYLVIHHAIHEDSEVVRVFKMEEAAQQFASESNRNWLTEWMALDNEARRKKLPHYQEWWEVKAFPLS